MAMKKKSCCYRLTKYLTITILLGSLIGAGFTVPLNIELIKENDQDSTSKRYFVYGLIGCLASLTGISLVAVSVDSYCLTLFSGVLMVLMTLVVAFATATTIFVFDQTIWINVAELGACFLATIFLLLFTGMVKDRRSKKRSSVIAPFTDGEIENVPSAAKPIPQTPTPTINASSGVQEIENNMAPSPPPPTAIETPLLELQSADEVYEPSRPPSPVPEINQYNKFLSEGSPSAKPESINEESEEHENEGKE